MTNAKPNAPLFTTQLMIGIFITTLLLMIPSVRYSVSCVIALFEVMSETMRIMWFMLTDALTF